MAGLEAQYGQARRNQPSRRDRIRSRLGSTVDPSERIRESAQEQEASLQKTFGAARRRLQGQEREAQRQSNKGLDRLRAQVGTAGGAIEKARQTQQQELQQNVGEVETQLAAQEAAGIAGVKQARDAALTQAEQFKATMDFQKDSIAEQFAFQWAEFDENLKTNFINAVTALKDAGIQSAADWGRLIPTMNILGGERHIDMGVLRSEEAKAARQAQLEKEARMGNKF